MSQAAPTTPLVVICGLDHANIDEEEDGLHAGRRPVRVVVARTADEYLERCGEADALLVQYGDVARRVFEGLPRLRVLVRYGVGVDGIDLAAATDRGIPVVNVPGLRDRRGREPRRRAAPRPRPQAAPGSTGRRGAGGWDVFRVGPVTRLAGQTVGIVGCGRIGSAVARKLGGFDVRLLGCDPLRLRPSRPGVQPVAFERLLAESDYVTIHCPLTAGDAAPVRRGALARMRPTAVLINTARGGIVDTRGAGRGAPGGAPGGRGARRHSKRSRSTRRARSCGWSR